jgi:hypothetical protein
MIKRSRRKQEKLDIKPKHTPKFLKPRKSTAKTIVNTAEEFQTLYQSPSRQEISLRTFSKIKRLEKFHCSKKQEHSISDSIAYWIFLFLVMVTNFFVSLIIIFMLLSIDHYLLYLIMVVMGLGFGFMYERMIHTIHHLFPFHYVYAKLFIITTGGINIFYIVSISSFLFNFFGMSNDVYSHLAISVTYFFSYLLPYFISLLFKSIRNDPDLCRSIS